MKYLLLLATLCSFTPLFAQSKLDSMLTHIPHEPDTVRVQALNNLCFELAFSEPENAKQYGKAGYALAEQLGYTLGKAKALNRLGIVHDVSGNYDSAMQCYQQAGIYYAQINNLKGKASTLNNIGLLYAGKGHFRKALANYYTALKLFEQLGDPSDIAGALNNIGSTYSDLYRYKLAFLYYQKAAVINKQLGNMDALASNYTNISSSLRELGQFDSALYYIHLAIPMEIEQNNQWGLGLCYNILGTIYSHLDNHHKSIDYLKQSIDIRKSLNDKSGVNSGLMNLAGEYSHLGQNNKALEYALEAHELALEQSNYRLLRKTSQMLFFLYKKTGQYQKATEYVDLSWEARDSVMNEESVAQIAEMEVRYESEKKALEIEKQNLTLANAQYVIEQKQSTIVIISIVSLLMLISGFGVYKHRQYKQQLIFDARLLEEQMVRNKAIIETEEKERIRIARELHDGIGQQLSAAKMNLSAFENKISEQDKTNYEMLVQLVDDAVKEVRSVSHNMMPNALIRSGLVSAVRDFVHKLSSTDALKVDLQIVGLNNRLEDTTETVLYRVLQECVSNVIKHADATHISIQLVKHDTHLNMLIEDNGKGFDTNLIRSAEGIGLKNMISRIAYLNGTIDFDSYPGTGTTVNIDIPL